MTQIELIQHWRKGAKDSLAAAQFSFEQQAVGLCIFHCHLSMEKALKALYMEQQHIAAPLIHDLDALALLVNVTLTGNQRMFLHELSPQGVKGRYDEIDYHLNLPALLDPATAVARVREILPVLAVL